jgi:DNA-binding IclR family transcriptional regulator
MPLSKHEADVLRYLEHRTATAANIRRDLKLGRAPVRNALHELADKKYVSVDHSTLPASWSITDLGAAVLAAAPEQEPQ